MGIKHLKIKKGMSFNEQFRLKWVRKIMRKTEDEWLNQDPKYHDEDGMVW